MSWVESLPLRRIDVLWPLEFHASSPPWKPGEEDEYRQAPRYGKWFAELFREWWKRNDPSLYIRSFKTQVALLQHGAHRVNAGDFFRNRQLGMFVVNTDGAFELHDYLRVAGDSVTRTPYGVQTHGISDLHRDTSFDRLLHLDRELPRKCAGCRHVEICGGGFLPGRAQVGNLISSEPSVLCHDQFYFFSEVASLVNEARERIRERSLGSAAAGPPGRTGRLPARGWDAPAPVMS
jgi:uncharacterized protein